MLEYCLVALIVASYLIHTNGDDASMIESLVAATLTGFLWPVVLVLWLVQGGWR